MDTRKAGRQNVYAAAEAWVRRALQSDDSLFTPGRRIWTSEWLDELHRRFLDRPDESGATFLDKLERQLTGSPPEAFQLMAEVLYVHFLIVSTRDGAEQKKQVDRILGWSPEPVAVPSELAAGLAPGLANPGQGFHSYRPFQVGLIIEFASQWKQLEPDARQRLLDDPWAFKDFVMDLHLQSAMFRDHQNTPRAQRHALLHLVHPDTFEPIVSAIHKDKIAAAFERLVEDPEQDVDRKLQEIRADREREMRLQYSNTLFSLPKNLYVIGTMNTADRSNRADRRHRRLLQCHRRFQGRGRRDRRSVRVLGTEDGYSSTAVARLLRDGSLQVPAGRVDQHAAVRPPNHARRGWASKAQARPLVVGWLSGTLDEVLERVRYVAERVRALRDTARRVLRAA